jgi:DNA-binding NtrC family response regulator
MTWASLSGLDLFTFGDYNLIVNSKAASGRVLVLDDEVAHAELVALALGEAGWDIQVAHSVAQGQELLNHREFDVALLDLHLPDGSGTDVLKRLIEDGSLTEVIMLTGDRDVTTAVEVMKLGASDYLVKPIPIAELEVAVVKARERHRLRVDNQRLRLRLGRLERNTTIVTEDPEFLRTLGSLEQVGPSDLPVLIHGEEGTGKELMARAVHDSSHRRMEPFMSVSCATLPAQELEAELFGYDAGAFPGATDRKPGLLEVADRGTLFLDEVDQLNLALQPKLLRVIETQEFSRMGSTRMTRAHLRLVSGTSRNLKELVGNGEFRKDFYDQINGVTLEIPPLRARTDDVLPLAIHFLRLHEIKRGLSARALEVLKAYAWPGNVRELQMVIRRAGVLATTDLIEPRDLSFDRPAS